MHLVRASVRLSALLRRRWQRNHRSRASRRVRLRRRRVGGRFCRSQRPHISPHLKTRGPFDCTRSNQASVDQNSRQKLKERKTQQDGHGSPQKVPEPPEDEAGCHHVHRNTGVEQRNRALKIRPSRLSTATVTETSRSKNSKTASQASKTKTNSLPSWSRSTPTTAEQSTTPSS